MTPVYDSEELISRIPDFRHAFYGNPDITSRADAVSFYSSDMKETYVVPLQENTDKGEAVMIQGEFVVK